MNVVIMSRMVELSESRSRFYKIRRLVTNWKAVALISVGALTIKVIAEQLVMVIR